MPRHDWTFKIRTGLLRIIVIPENKKENDSLNFGKRTINRILRKDIPLVINIYDNIFVQDIYATFGDKDKCNWAIKEITGEKNINVKTCEATIASTGRVDSKTVGMWFQNPWFDFRHSENCSVLAHECLHCVENIMNQIGMQPHEENDELRTYYMQWLMNSITCVINAQPYEWVDMCGKVQSLTDKRW